jgi:hypothetical protein
MHQMRNQALSYIGIVRCIFIVAFFKRFIQQRYLLHARSAGDATMDCAKRNHQFSSPLSCGFP